MLRRTDIPQAIQVWCSTLRISQRSQEPLTRTSETKHFGGPDTWQHHWWTIPLATHCLYQTQFFVPVHPMGVQLHGVDSNIIGERSGTPNNVQQDNSVKLTPSPSLRCWPSGVTTGATTGATTGSRPSQQRLHLRQRGESGSDPFLWPCCGWVSYMDCSKWAKNLVIR